MKYTAKDVIEDLNGLLRDDVVGKSHHRNAVLHVRKHPKRFEGDGNIRLAVDTALDETTP